MKKKTAPAKKATKSSKNTMPMKNMPMKKMGKKGC